MLSHLMTCITYNAIKKDLISEFRSAKTLNDQKKAFMSLQIWSSESAPSFSECFYCEGQFLVICDRLELDDVVTSAFSLLASHPHLKLYLKGITCTLSSICEIKEALWIFILTSSHPP